MSVVEICMAFMGVCLLLTAYNLIILALAFKLYTEFFKERVKGTKSRGG